MQYITPKAILLAKTVVDMDGQTEFLQAIGAPDWDTDVGDSAERLIEIAGRSCYKSFGVGLNPNVTRVREGNREYLDGVLKSGHGSVLEHGAVCYALVNVSRVLTHELVRHRAGTAFSQESLRFVRLDELRAYYPEVAFGECTLTKLAAAIPTDELFAPGETVFGNNPDGSSRVLLHRPAPVDTTDTFPHDLFPELRSYNVLTPEELRQVWVETRAKYLHDTFVETFEMLESTQKDIAAYLRLDHCKSFEIKKKVTSGMRRLAPIGLATVIVVTANHRTMRHVITKRTERYAEEEIRLVYAGIAEKVKERYPNIYQDMEEVGVFDGIPEYAFKYGNE